MLGLRQLGCAGVGRGAAGFQLCPEPHNVAFGLLAAAR